MVPDAPAAELAVQQVGRQHQERQPWQVHLVDAAVLSDEEIALELARPVEAARRIGDERRGVRHELSELARQLRCEQGEIAPEARLRDLGGRLELRDLEADSLVQSLAVAEVLRLVPVRDGAETHAGRARHRPHQRHDGQHRGGRAASEDSGHPGRSAADPRTDGAVEPPVHAHEHPERHQRRPPPAQIHYHVGQDGQHGGGPGQEGAQRQQAADEAEQRPRPRDVGGREEVASGTGVGGRQVPRGAANEPVEAEDGQPRGQHRTGDGAGAGGDEQVLDVAACGERCKHAAGEPDMQAQGEGGQPQDAEPAPTARNDEHRVSRRSAPIERILRSPDPPSRIRDRRRGGLRLR